MSFENEVPGNNTAGEDCRVRLLKVTDTGSVEIPGKGWPGNYNPQQAMGNVRVILSWNQVMNTG
jgi:hypothetical protein